MPSFTSTVTQVDNDAPNKKISVQGNFLTINLIKINVNQHLD